ncbi:MAG: glycerophosphoryl diester phosphodiesterase [Gammaproteobacteria bacterium]|jgi:glycerophosphoryl diester phosphodiesterase
MCNVRTSNLLLRLSIYLLILGLAGMASTAYGFDLQGHRGARGLSPENSLVGFAKALSIGVSTLELDLAVTQDSRVVVMHNPRFEPEIARDANGNWLTKSSASILSMPLAEVQTFDVGRLNPGTRYAQQFANQQSIDGTRVPTLEEVFELVNRSGNREIGFNIEIKINPEKPELSASPEPFVKAVLKVVYAYRMGRRVSIQSFDWRALQAVQQQDPSIKTAYLTAAQPWLNNLQTDQLGKSPWLGGLDIDDFSGNIPRAIKSAGGDIWSSYHKEVTRESIAEAQQLKLLVNVWTVNEPKRMRELIEMGVDGIITDYPDRLREVLMQLEMPVPLKTALDF